MCPDGEVTASEGKLEQSGNTYLATTVWTCSLCGYVRYEPALSARWRSCESGRPGAHLGMPKRAA
jgi:hypothetical protein